MMDLSANYLNSSRKQFQYYKSLGDKTFEQISDDELFWRYSPESNSIAIIVNHMWGNMLSRWTDFLTSDGEKEWRKRDSEFESVIQTREELLTKWNEGWQCLFDALDTIHSANFHQEVFIRNQRHSIPDAINRQMMHYAYHVGQIVFIGTQLKGKDWQSLSIPKGQSQAFNKDKFGKGQHGGHFTDEFK